MDPRNSAALIIFHCVCVCNRSVLHKTAPQAHTGSGNPGNPTLRYLAKLNDRHLKKTFSFLQVVFFFFFFSAPDKRLPLDNGFVYTDGYIKTSNHYRGSKCRSHFKGLHKAAIQHNNIPVCVTVALFIAAGVLCLMDFKELAKVKLC